MDYRIALILIIAIIWQSHNICDGLEEVKKSIDNVVKINTAKLDNKK
jgi:hypothetical protein